MYRSEDNEKLKLTPQRIHSDMKRKVGQTGVNLVMAYSTLIVGGATILLSLFLGLGYRLPSAVQVIGVLLIGTAVVAVIIRLYKRLASRYVSWIKTGKYHVVKATLSSMALHGSQGPYWFLRSHRVPFDNALYFGSFEPYYAEPNELTRISEGDEYLLVVFDEEPNRPRMIYRADTYDWRG